MINENLSKIGELGIWLIQWFGDFFKDIKVLQIRTLNSIIRFLVAPLRRKAKDRRILISQTKSGFFVSQRNAKNGRILPFVVFQKVEQKRWSINLLLMSLLLVDLQYLAYQESVYGFLLLSNEKNVGT